MKEVKLQCLGDIDKRSDWFCGTVFMSSLYAYENCIARCPQCGGGSLQIVRDE